MKCRICEEEIENEDEEMNGIHNDCLEDDSDLASDISQAIPIND